MRVGLKGTRYAIKYNNYEYLFCNIIVKCIRSINGHMANPDLLNKNRLFPDPPDLKLPLSPDVLRFARDCCFHYVPFDWKLPVVEQMYSGGAEFVRFKMKNERNGKTIYLVDGKSISTRSPNSVQPARGLFKHNWQRNTGEKTIFTGRRDKGSEFYELLT